MRFVIVILLILAGPVRALHAQTGHPLAGDWKGHIALQGIQLIIQPHFERTDTGWVGRIDIPQQGASGLPLQDIRLTAGDSVHFAFRAGPGLAAFRGYMDSDTAITGTFYQNGMTFPFSLARLKPQQQPDSVPYRQQAMIIRRDSVTIGGTLTLPRDGQPRKLVIIISGSGAQDRDGSLPVTDFKPYAALADALTRRGVATFRYDDRGIGASTGRFSAATLDMLASDVMAVVDEFSDGRGRDFRQITLLGHSQGGVVAGKAAAGHAAVDRLILMASTGVPLQDVLRFQVRQSFEQGSVHDTLITREIAAREHLMKAISHHGEVEIEQALANYRRIFAGVQRSAGVDSSRAAAIAGQQAARLADIFGSPQTQSLFYYDPTVDLHKLDIPVLVLFGGKDVQVTPAMNRAPIEQALKQAGVPYQTTVFEDTNHLFQRAATGQVQEYAALESAFTDGFIRRIIRWMNEK